MFTCPGNALMKKKTKIIIVVLIVLVLLIPIPTRYKGEITNDKSPIRLPWQHPRLARKPA